MKKCLILLALLFTHVLFAQNVSYTVLETHAKLPFAQLGLIAVGGDIAANFNELDGMQINFGPGFDSKIHLGNILHLHAHGYRASYVDVQRFLNSDNGEIDAANINETVDRKASSLDLGVSFTPFVKKSQGRIAVAIKEGSYVSGGATSFSSKYIMAKSDVVSIFGFRGGVSRYRYNLIGNLGTESGENLRDHYAVLNGNALFGGVVFTSFGHVKINAKGYGIKEAGRYFNLYADVLFGPDTRMMATSGQQELQVIKISGSDIGNNSLGFRLGWEKYTSKRWGIGYRFETGIRPGFGKSPYLRMDVVLPMFAVTRSPQKANQLLKKLKP
ncbi:MAG: hypothetical protein MRZ79_24755 [Bacteroidia bacterium]|nr:hypothetical protein [Bacteroidia bacterium]